jgi:hypothetical protein
MGSSITRLDGCFFLLTSSPHESRNPTLFGIENGQANMFEGSFQLCPQSENRQG